jgi:hypothetical protein
MIRINKGPLMTALVSTLAAVTLFALAVTLIQRPEFMGAWERHDAAMERQASASQFTAVFGIEPPQDTNSGLIRKDPKRLNQESVVESVMRELQASARRAEELRVIALSSPQYTLTHRMSASSFSQAHWARHDRAAELARRFGFMPPLASNR